MVVNLIIAESMLVSELNNSSTFALKGIVSCIIHPLAYPVKGSVISVETEILLELKTELILEAAVSGFISIIGVFLVLFKNKNPKTDGLEDEYTKGYKKGVTKRRWLFFIIGFVLSTLIFTNIDKGSNDEITKTKGLKDGKEIIKFDRGIQSDWNESFLVQGEFYQENEYEVEVTLKLNDDNTYSFNSYRSGEVVQTKEGSWRTKVLKGFI